MSRFTLFDFPPPPPCHRPRSADHCEPDNTLNNSARSLFAPLPSERSNGGVLSKWGGGKGRHAKCSRSFFFTFAAHSRDHRLLVQVQQPTTLPAVSAHTYWALPEKKDNRRPPPLREAFKNYLADLTVKGVPPPLYPLNGRSFCQKTLSG